MASYNNILILFILIIINLFFSEAQNDPPLYQYCSSEKTTANTSFQHYVQSLLSNLSSQATGKTQFYNTNFTGANPSDSIYGLYMCRGDVSTQLCRQCVQRETKKLSSSECSVSKETVTWYEECMVRYSTNYIFSTVATTQCNTGKVSYNNRESFMQLYFQTMNQTADEAAHGHNKFSTKEAHVFEFQTLYCLAQCTPDLSLHDCRTCLAGAIENIPNSPHCSGVRLGGKVLYPSCNIRYESYPFYPSKNPPLDQIPETKPSSHHAADSTFSSKESNLYLNHSCSSSNKTFTTVNNTFQINSLNTLFSYLISNATTKKFHEADVNNNAYGLYMCRGDVSSGMCEKCVLNARYRISSECSKSFQEAIVWYSHCMLRYSYRNNFKKIETGPMFSELNITNSTSNKEQGLFTVTLAKMLDKVAVKAGDSAERFGRESLKLNDLQTLYTLAQCTRDLPTAIARVVWEF